MPGRHGACWTPAEGTTEELMTIVDSVASYPIILCHHKRRSLFPRMWCGSEVSVARIIMPALPLHLEYSAN